MVHKRMLTLTTERQMITKRCSLDEADHLTVYSTGAFAVNVQSKDAQLSSVNTSITEKLMQRILN